MSLVRCAQLRVRKLPLDGRDDVVEEGVGGKAEVGAEVGGEDLGRDSRLCVAQGKSARVGHR